MGGIRRAPSEPGQHAIIGKPHGPPNAARSRLLGRPEGVLIPENLELGLTRGGAVRFGVHASPRARVSAVTAFRAGAVVVRLAAPPVDGAANAELVDMLAEALGVAKRDVSVVRGETARHKLVEVRGLGADEVRQRLKERVDAHR